MDTPIIETLDSMDRSSESCIAGVKNPLEKPNVTLGLIFKEFGKEKEYRKSFVCVHGKY